MAWYQKTSDVSVAAAGWTTLAQIKVEQGASVLEVMLTNSADKALDQFEVAYSVFSDLTWQVIAGATSDFAAATIQWPVLGAGADLTTLPLSNSAAMSLYIRGKEYVRLRASSAAGSDTTITHSWCQR